MHWNSGSAIYLLKVAVAISFLSHGRWNLSNAGLQWWKESCRFPLWFRPYIGALEILIAIFLFIPVLDFYAAILGAGLMVGAIVETYRNGYSAKNHGFELGLTYLLILLYVAVACRPILASS